MDIMSSQAEAEVEQADAAPPETAPARDQKPKPSPPKADKLPPYSVVLHNDDHNDMVYVIAVICALTPLMQHTAMRKMFEAHKRGRSLLLTTHKERAELYRDQFKSKGLTVTIQPA